MLAKHSNFKRLAVIFCTIVMLLLCSAKTFADSYDVTAVVPYDPPTTAATIESPANNASLSTNSVVIVGTCEILIPASIISIWNGTTLLGSTTCLVGGNYSLSVALYSGINVLIAKSSNINSLYGPDSTPTIVIYTPNTSISPAPDPTPQPTPLTPPVGPANNPQSSGELLITSPSPFGVSDNNNFVTITLNVSGGSNPYILLINWGDGSTQSQQINNGGEYIFSHSYEKPANYTVLATVTDSIGQNKSFSWAVTSKQVPTNQNHESSSKPDDKKESNSSKLFFYGLLIALLAIVSLIIFLFGRYYQSKKFPVIVAKKRRKKSKAKK